MTNIQTNGVTQSVRPLEPQPAAIVVGASSGIGAALVKELAKRGYRVGALARREDKLDELVAGIKGQTLVKAIPHDVTDYEAIPDVFAQLVDELGGLDLIIYAAGVMPNVGPEEYDFEKDRQQVEINLLGAMGWLNFSRPPLPNNKKRDNYRYRLSCWGPRPQRESCLSHDQRGPGDLFGVIAQSISGFERTGDDN